MDSLPPTLIRLIYALRVFRRLQVILSLHLMGLLTRSTAAVTVVAAGMVVRSVLGEEWYYIVVFVVVVMGWWW